MHVTDPDRPDLGGNIRHGHIETFCPEICTFLVNRFCIRSVLDVGCGEGHAVWFFQRLGVLAHGIDGLRQNIERAVTPIALHDLCAGPYVIPVDMVWSCEVAEHIEERYVDNYLRTLANGRIIAMTHALPDQEGYHHVNCQPREYWIERIEKLGYTLSDENSTFVEIAGKDRHWNYFQHTGLVFLKDD